ncbi:hypothetical protein FNV43_RR07113 [Rhamnella rubrinervis]|uniref:Uncharacterized protein n=1 Tax=Rhamnella rubrinervis TaxID=2594499 RepID=A0A8K0MM29_9ROSA|nr:hypothetical protein FNV43_RR07113 [Rhamnella rubrinervis]
MNFQKTTFTLLMILGMLVCMLNHDEGVEASRVLSLSQSRQSSIFNKPKNSELALRLLSLDNSGPSPRGAGHDESPDASPGR